MVSYVIDEAFLERLSHTSRMEVLLLLEQDTMSLKGRIRAGEWFPDRGKPYPLTEEEAEKLLRALTDEGRRLLGVFIRHIDDGAGYASLEELEEATGHTDPNALSRELTSVTHVVRSITGQGDAWLFDWNPEDWVYDESTGRYTSGRYFISSPTVDALAGVAARIEAELS
jgi:hypothetical protein